MINVINNKEVSCRILTSYFYLLNQKGIDANKVLDGMPYNKAYLSKRSERIEWSVYCKLMKNMRRYFSQNEFEEVGVIHVKKGFYPEGVLAGFIFFSSSKISKVLTKQIFRIGKHMFSCINTITDYPSKNKIIVKLYLDQDKEFLQEFFLLTKGTWNQLGNLVGHKNFKIDLKWIQYGAIYNISWEKESMYFKLKRGIRWMFSIGKAFTDLTDSHQQLLEHYEKLEKSKKLLQKQTTQLKTAYAITKSIRQSRNIKNTLYAITEALIRESDFDFANIKIFKDLDGNKFEIEALSGFSENNNIKISQSIKINNELIGKLFISPRLGIEKNECEEILNYLQPIINISIHDALILRTVIDYKNNLETKVETRTSELKKTQIQLSKTILLLEDTQRAQNHFFTNISHEFRTPLTLILGPTNQILEISKNEKVKEEARLICRSAKKLNRLANQLLDISRIESGKIKLETSYLNLVEILNEIVSSFQSFAESKNIVLKFCAEEKNIFLFLDKDKIDKIISNILSNAIKFTPSGGIVEVEINLTSPPAEGLGEAQNGLQPTYVNISITDSGIGIPEEQLNKIFDRFYQVDQKLSKEYEGSGVGLSLTKELIELHKGKITVESEEGKGSTFKIFLPLGKKHLRPEEIIEVIPNNVGTSENEFIPEVEDLPIVVKSHNHELTLESIDKQDQPALLIVEDNIDVRNYITDILKNHYQILEACNGEEGLTKSIEQIPDLIISDIMMPKMDGFQLCNKLKNDYRTSHIPVILLTAKTTMQDKIEGFKTGLILI